MPLSKALECRDLIFCLSNFFRDGEVFLKVFLYLIQSAIEGVGLKRPFLVYSGRYQIRLGLCAFNDFFIESSHIFRYKSRFYYLF